MTYTPTKWVNGGKPAINAENLNKIEETLAQLSVPDITSTTSTTQPNSYAGRENILEIGGVTEQDSTSGTNLINQACVPAGSAKKHFLKAGTYTVTRDASEVGNSLYLGAYDSNNNVITENTLVVQGFGISSNKEYWYGGAAYTSTTFTTNVDCYVKIGVINGSGKTYLMLNAGNTALPYEKYTGGIPAPNPSYPMEIKKSVVKGIRTHWKNFAKLSVNSQTLYGVEVVRNDNSITLKGTATGSDGIFITDAIKLKVGTYYTNVLMYRQDKKTNWLETIAKNSVFEVTDEEQIFRPLQWVNQGQVYNETIIPMVCLAEYKDVVEPYTESSYTFSQPIELYGKDDVQDVITPKEIGRKYEYIRVTGSDVKSVILYADTGTAITINKVAKIDGKCLSNGFISVSFNDRVKDVNSFRCYVDTTSYVVFRVPKSENDNFASKDDAINFFDNNEIFIAYETAEETTEALPIADQIGLNSLATYDGITYVEFDSEIQPTLKAEYGTSKVGGYTLESLLTARNNDLRG
jgi:hypothetical protein